MMSSTTITLCTSQLNVKQKSMHNFRIENHLFDFFIMKATFLKSGIHVVNVILLFWYFIIFYFTHSTRIILMKIIIIFLIFILFFSIFEVEWGWLWCWYHLTFYFYSDSIKSRKVRLISIEFSHSVFLTCLNL